MRSAAKPLAAPTPPAALSPQLDRRGAQGGAAAVLRFVADTPTITMSRLKALLTVRARPPLFENLDPNLRS